MSYLFHRSCTSAFKRTSTTRSVRRPQAPSWPPLGAVSVALVLGLLALSPRATAQNAEAGIFGEVVDVRVINVEVVVEDKDGLRVQGLDASDLLLTVDGKEVDIDYFTEIRGGQAIQAGEPTGPSGLPSLEPGQDVGTSYLVFVDDFFSIARDRDRLLASIRDDLPLLGPQDRMAVVSFDGTKLDMLSTWSQSVPALERVFRDAAARPALGLQRLSEQRQVDFERLNEVLDTAQEGEFQIEDFSIDSLSTEERYYATRLGEQVERSIAAASSALRSFASPPGRKVMLLLSGGWPFLPTDFVTGTDRFSLVDRVAPEGSELFEPLTDTANLLGFTLYPVDVPGYSAATVDVALTDPDNSRSSFQRGLLRQQDQEYSLRYLANRTGGRALLGKNRANALSVTVEDTRSYYWLGFIPKRELDDQRHDIKVSVKGGKFKVRSREGFLDSSREREVTMSVESTLLFGNSSNEGGLGLKLGESRRSGLRKVDRDLSILIPVDQLTFLPSGDKFVSEVELRIAVIDSGGGRAPIPVIPFTLRSGEEPQAGEFARYDTVLKLRKAKHRAVVAVYDRASGRILTGGIDIAP